MRAAQEVSAERERKAARREELAAQIPELEAKVERVRDRIGRAVAAGSETDTLRAELRTLEDELDGGRRAVAVLNQELDALAAEEQESAGVEADRHAQVLAEKAEAAAVAAAQEAHAFLARYSPLAVEAIEAYDVAVAAEQAADKANGRRPPAGHPHVARSIEAQAPLMSMAPAGPVRLALRSALLAAGLPTGDGA